MCCSRIQHYWESRSLFPHRIRLQGQASYNADHLFILFIQNTPALVHLYQFCESDEPMPHCLEGCFAPNQFSWFRFSFRNADSTSLTLIRSSPLSSSAYPHSMPLPPWGVYLKCIRQEVVHHLIQFSFVDKLVAAISSLRAQIESHVLLTLAILENSRNIS